MRNVILLNHKQAACGVYQYMKKTATILKNSTNFNFIYIEVENENEFWTSVLQYDPYSIIYNYHPLTMAWLGTHSLDIFPNAKHFGIHHEGGKPGNINFTGYIDTDCLLPNGVPRPLIEGFDSIKSYNHINYAKKSPPIINSFGFGFGSKGFGRVCQMVNDQFDEAIIRLHIPHAYYGDRDKQSIQNIHPGCRNEIKKEGIKLEITTDFKTDTELLEFLSEGDLNLFLYDDMPGRGLSSVIDYALSVNVPLGINKTTMFRHISDAVPSICVEDSSLQELMDRGIESVLNFRHKWSNSALINKYEELIK